MDATMKKCRFFMLVILMGFFLTLPRSSLAEEEKTDDMTPGEALKEIIEEKKEALESRTPEEKEAIQKERKRRREERKIPLRARRGGRRSLTG